MRMRHVVILSLLTAAGLASAQQADTVRVRGTIERVDATSLTVKSRSGESVTLARPADMGVTEVVPIAMSEIKAGSFIGSAAMPQPDGTQRALEVHVFPEAARGTGEGFRPYDAAPRSTMTNATVAELASAPTAGPGGERLLLKYKGGEQTLIVPAGTPVVTFKPGKTDEAQLVVPGAKAVVFVRQNKDGQPAAVRLMVGRNGFAPPM